MKKFWETVLTVIIWIIVVILFIALIIGMHILDNIRIVIPWRCV